MVFDRDEHHSYHAALAQPQRRNGKLRNDNRMAVPVEAVASVPCFELWLLLHFEGRVSSVAAARRAGETGKPIYPATRRRVAAAMATQGRLNDATALCEVLGRTHHRLWMAPNLSTAMHELASRDSCT